MGIIAKIITKKRTEPSTVIPNPRVDPLNWLPVSSPTTMAIALDAALELDVQHAQSSTRRGKTYGPILLSGLGDALTSKSSEILVQALPGNSWAISQGSFLRDGRTYLDWMVHVQLRSDGTFQITTPKYLSQNGALANAKNHDRVRDYLDVALARPVAISSRAEAELFEGMIQRPIAGAYNSHIGQRRVKLRVTTTRTIDDTRFSLDNEVGMALLAHGNDRWRFGLGLESSWSENWLELWMAPCDNGSALEGVITVGPPVGGVHDECVSYAAQMCFATLQMALTKEDHTLTVSPASFKEAMSS